MSKFFMSEKMVPVHSDIRGPLYVEAMEMQKQGTEVLKLNTGNPASFGFTMPDSVRRALTENMDKAVAYCDFRGMPEAREAICAYHRKKGTVHVSPDQIFIGNGVSELVSMVTAVVLHYGDEILIPSPSYSLWTNSAYIAGAKPVFYTCDESSDWVPDLRDIQSKITLKTKALVLINPNNPTGALYPREILEQIVAIAKEHHLVLFSDEIYDRLLMDGKEHTSTSAVAQDDVVVITMNGLSKSHIICGFRCGWMMITGKPEEYDEIMQGMVKYTSMRLCGNALTQLVVPAALADHESTDAMMRPGGRLYEQREVTIREIAKIPQLSVVKNSAAFYVFPKIDKKICPIDDDRKFAMDLLHEKHILIVPASGFDYPGNDHFRIVMLPEPEILAGAVREIGDFLSHYHS
ncbi:MAG: aminotransferase class I/II-fold pyridoxal phosphate-dependent enzyme [Ruminococcus sp.]|nr:aminotransferase class I/II-fold pyridoxal phosphate-dependent enzyme [Candidatus Apopatosoma intestinale]